jgi:glycosyltransferase involved in cell wall biosynthesis
MTPFVSIIIPCRNEEKFILKTLENIIEQDYPKNKTEIFVVDGLSTDRTRQIANDFINKNENIIILDNPEKIVPSALNKAIHESKGEIIIRMDAHSIYPVDYVSILVKSLIELEADNVGGVWVTEPGSTSLVSKAIAIATSHPFGIGNAHYRLGAKEPMQVDTVPFGCYRKEVFERIGLFDEDLIRNQDDEFNARLIKNGGKIYLIPSLKIRYYAREKLSKMALMFYQYGLYKPLVNKKIGYPATIRQLIPPLFTLAIIILTTLSIINGIALKLLAILLAIYFLADFLISFFLSIKNKLSLFIFLLITFPVIHFSYGWGYLKGIFRFLFLRKHLFERGNTHINR